MSSSMIKMFNGAATSAGVSVEIDVPVDGFLTDVFLELTLITDSSPALGHRAEAELSFMATDTFGSGHDNRGLIGAVTVAVWMLTSGAAQVARDMGWSGIKIKVFAGERIYLHVTTSNAAITADATAFLVFDGKDMPRTAVRRR